MKLLNKTSIYYLLFAVPVFAVCSILIYYFISIEIKDELDENLWKEKIQTEQKMLKGIEPASLAGDDLLITKINQPADKGASYSDTLLFNASDEEILPFRVLCTGTNIKGQNYSLIIRRSYVESDDLISSILIPIVILFMVLLIGILFINYWISKKIWLPFYETIEQLNFFDLGTSAKLQLTPTNIIEFKRLQQSLNIMTQKAHTDYLKQKEFTENASHEIQTPLAIIQNKLELLIQSNKLGSEEMELISGIYDAASRLSHLNKTLLLLTKIENNQFTDNSSIEIKKEIEKSIAQFSEQAEHKKISIKTDLQDGTIVNMNITLCEMLLNNLLANAIRHNAAGGHIEIELKNKHLRISNSGNEPNIKSAMLFERFKKDSNSQDSIGLGLSIVKSICSLYSLTIEHAYQDGRHTFTINF